MIIGIGTDICDIRRIESSIEKFGTRFIEKIFTPFEQEYCESKSASGSAYAKRFAAKEAIAKALATENSGALPWTDVEVRNDASGRPVAKLYGKAVERLESIVPDGKTHVHLSLSDDYPYAVAYAIIETQEMESQS